MYSKEENFMNKNFENKIVVITGGNICIDGGMTKQMIYHGEHGWKYEVD